MTLIRIGLLAAWLAIAWAATLAPWSRKAASYGATMFALAHAGGFAGMALESMFRGSMGTHGMFSMAGLVMGALAGLAAGLLLAPFVARNLILYWLAAVLASFFLVSYTAVPSAPPRPPPPDLLP